MNVRVPGTQLQSRRPPGGASVTGTALASVFHQEPNCQPPAQGDPEGGPEVPIAGRPAGQGSFAFPFLGPPDVSAASGQGWGPDDPPGVAPGSLQSRQGHPTPPQTPGSAGSGTAGCDFMLGHACPWRRASSPRPPAALEPGMCLGPKSPLIVFCSPKASASPSPPLLPTPPKLLSILQATFSTEPAPAPSSGSSSVYVPQLQRAPLRLGFKGFGF